MSVDGLVLSHQGLVRRNILVLYEAVHDGCPSKVKSAVNRHLCVKNAKMQTLTGGQLLKINLENPVRRSEYLYRESKKALALVDVCNCRQPNPT